MFTARYRSILAGILALLTVFVVSCSSPTATKPPTYTTAQIEQIHKYVPKITELRDRMGALPSLIKNRDWVNVQTFIHGPLGSLRQDMAYLTQNLLTKEQPAARQAAREIFVHLEALDKAAQENNYDLAVENFGEAMKDFNTFLQLIPQV